MTTQADSANHALRKSLDPMPISGQGQADTPEALPTRWATCFLCQHITNKAVAVPAGGSKLACRRCAELSRGEVSDHPRPSDVTQLWLSRRQHVEECNECTDGSPGCDLGRRLDSTWEQIRPPS
jgi:hypothetical protein